MTYCIGLTGGIGSGKTLASDHFASLGVPIVDTDVIAREVVAPGQPALDALVTTFGQQVLHENKTLNRDVMRQIAFSSTDNKRKLDAITHPAIQQACQAAIDAITTPYCIIVIPLLTQKSDLFIALDRVVTVNCDEKIRLKRVMQRNNLSANDVEKIMRTQLTDEQRKMFTNDIIVNESSIEAVQQQVESLHNKYLRLSAANN